MFLSKEQKERRVIDLYYYQGKTFQEIAKEVNLSPNFLNTVLKKYEEEKNAAAVSKTKREEQEDKTSREVASFKLFSEGKNPIEVAIELKLPEEEVTHFTRVF
jgi:transposase